VAPELERTFAALGDSTRLSIVALLGKRPLRSGDLAAALATNRPAMSKHLRILREAGVVEEASMQDDARARVYRLCPGPFSELRAWLDEVEVFWASQLASFKAHAEQRSRKGRPRSGKGGRA
jgi:DNA-binding transcriptional ArsR family regulator